MKKFKINNMIVYANSIVEAVSTIKDSATVDQTLSALIQDEEAAIDAYSVAISNLKNKLSIEDIDLLTHILDEEKEHVVELKSIITHHVNTIKSKS